MVCTAGSLCPAAVSLQSSAPSWTDVGAFAVLAAQLVVLAVAALVAWRQLRHARRIREDEARPHVVVDLEVDQPAQDIYLVVSNLGRTTARDVRLTFDPQLTSSLDSDPNVVSPRDLKPLSEGIPSLPPAGSASA